MSHDPVQLFRPLTDTIGFPDTQALARWLVGEARGDPLDLRMVELACADIVPVPAVAVWTAPAKGEDPGRGRLLGYAVVRPATGWPLMTTTYDAMRRHRAESARDDLRRCLAA